MANSASNTTSEGFYLCSLTLQDTVADHIPQ